MHLSDLFPTHDSRVIVLWVLLCSAVPLKVREDGGHTEPGRDLLPGAYRLSASRAGNTEDLLWGSHLFGDCKCLFAVV